MYDTHIYVDGSFIDNRIGYGLVILRDQADKDAAPIAELCGPVRDPDVQSMRQVAGELIAVQTALAWCAEQQIEAVHIYYDYKGIEAWAVGAWKANLPATQHYARYVKGCGVRITWHKIASHTGNFWNERADTLAKQGARQDITRATQSDDSSIAPTTSPVAAESASRMAELTAVATEFVAYLAAQGIQAEFARLYNDQFARVLITPSGMFDLYHTLRKPLSPYLHNFKAKALENRVIRAWQTFRETRPE